jgi:quinol-cytochrome oxidoreductase complex cytochrome b subunit/mono/diheme cytochrome c family protein
MPRCLLLIPVVICTLGVLIFVSAGADAAPAPQTATTPTPTFDVARLAQPPTVYPPEQADNGAQTYWGICMDCHGDRGQGLIDEWRTSFEPDERDCWASGCHGPDFPENSFAIPPEGAPGIAGTGKLARFSNTFELQRFVRENMPLFPRGSLTEEEAWDVTAYVLKLNGIQPAGITLGKTNSSAIPIHHKVSTPESEIPGTLILSGVLVLAALGMGLQARAKSTTPLSRPNFVHHLHPPSIPALQSRFRYTLGAGGLAVFLSLVLLLTGLLEMYFYAPSPEQAAISVETITTLVPFGNLIRNLHYWSAQLLVVVMTIHLLRVVLTGAYAPPRRFNYLLGLGLLVFILLLDFTGYVLRWDEGIRWALVVGANLLKTIPGMGEGIYYFVIGGGEPGAATLTRFYAWHIFGLTTGAAILVIWHIFRLRRDGGIAVPPPQARVDTSRISRFELVRREALAMAVAGAIILLLSLLIPAPIDQPISDASLTAGDSRAPWFFLWVQQLLKWGDPFLLGVLVPVLVVAALGLLPYALPNAKNENLGRWFPRGNQVAQALAASIILAIFVLTIVGAVK